MRSQINEHLTVNHGCQNPTVRAANKLREFLETDSPILFLSSGGSSLSVLSELSDDFSWANITITVLDERVTDEQHNQNFFQLRQLDSFSEKKPNSHFINPLTDSGNEPVTAGKKFASSIRRWLENNPDGQVIATVGVGADGHIAGMLSTNKKTFADRFRGDRLAVGYEDQDLQNEFKKRITTTEVFFIDILDQAIVYAVGEEKCSILRHLVSGHTSIHKRPAELLKRTPAELFTDCELESIGR